MEEFDTCLHRIFEKKKNDIVLVRYEWLHKNFFRLSFGHTDRQDRRTEKCTTVKQYSPIYPCQGIKI